MKNILKILLGLSLALPFVASAATAIPLIATSTTGTLIYPAPLNGIQQAIMANFFQATSTTATSTFAGGITGPGSFTVQLSSGNVGIGTTSPDVKLSVIGDVSYSSSASFPGFMGRLTTESTNSQLWAGFTRNLIGRASVTDYTIAGDTPDTYDGMIFQNGAINFLSGTGSYNAGDVITPTSRMYINGTNGNVGIGTTTPWKKLAVSGDAMFGSNTSGQSTFIENAGSPNYGSAVYLTTDLGATQGATRLLTTANLSGGTGIGSPTKPNFAIQYSTTNEGYGTDPSSLTYATALTVDGTSGNVGIGTTSPWAQLSVNPNGVTGPEFAVGSTTKTDFVVTNGGNVGINFQAPVAKLQIQSGGGQILNLVNGSGATSILWDNNGQTQITAGQYINFGNSSYLLNSNLGGTDGRFSFRNSSFTDATGHIFAGSGNFGTTTQAVRVDSYTTASSTNLLLEAVATKGACLIVKDVGSETYTQIYTQGGTILSKVATSITTCN